jgi:D-lactate dehydrogenase
MKLYFVSTEPEEREFFAKRLAPWNPVFVRELEDLPDDVEVLSIFIYDGIDEAFLARHPRLRFIASRSSSVDHLDLKACARRGVEVAGIPKYDGNSVAEHTFALLLAVARRFRASTTLRQHGDFSHAELRGFELRGKTLGLIGVGRIGVRVAELARAFGMKVIAYDPRPNAAHARQKGFRYLSLDSVLARAEILSLHAALTEGTRHLINAATLAKCREGVVIINTARGALIDTAALVAALESGHVGGAGIDVLEDERVLRRDAKNVLATEIAARVHGTGKDESPERKAERKRQITSIYSSNSLLERPEVVFTPHIAFNTTETVDAIAGQSADNIERFLRKQEMAYQSK